MTFSEVATLRGRKLRDRIVVAHFEYRDAVALVFPAYYEEVYLNRIIDTSLNFCISP